MSLHLGYKSEQSKPADHEDTRNGASVRTRLAKRGTVRADLPSDWDGSFELCSRSMSDDSLGSTGASSPCNPRDMSVREIQAVLAESYCIEVSPAFINLVTDEVMAETIAWQSGLLACMYPVTFFDALCVKIRRRTTARLAEMKNGLRGEPCNPFNFYLVPAAGLEPTT